MNRFMATNMAGRLYGALCVALGLCVASFLLTAWRHISFPHQLDFGEALLLEIAHAVATGQGLLRFYELPSDTYPLRLGGYPPLYPLLVAPTALWGAPSFWGGRLFSTLCTLVTAWCIFALVKHMTGERRAAGVSALLFLSLPVLARWGSLMRVDMLALALSTAGVLIIARNPRSNGAFAAGVCLLAGAIYTRQTYLISAPFAALILLFRVSATRATLFALTLAVLVGAPLALLNAVTDNGFWFNIAGVYSSTPSWNFDAGFWIDNLLFVGPVLLIILGVYVWRDRSVAFLNFYLLGSLVGPLGMVARRSGANINYLLELCVALCLITGLLLARIFQDASVRRRLAWIAVLLAQALLFLVVNIVYLTELQERYAQVPELDSLAREVDAAKGMVIADEDMGLLVQQGYPILFATFDFAQMAAAGRWSQEVVLRDLKARRFQLIIIHRRGESVIASRWTPEMLQAIHTEYVRSDAFKCCEVYRPRVD